MGYITLKISLHSNWDKILEFRRPRMYRPIMPRPWPRPCVASRVLQPRPWLRPRVSWPSSASVSRILASASRVLSSLASLPNKVAYKIEKYVQLPTKLERIKERKTVFVTFFGRGTLSLPGGPSALSVINTSFGVHFWSRRSSPSTVPHPFFSYFWGGRRSGPCTNFFSVSN